MLNSFNPITVLVLFGQPFFFSALLEATRKKPHDAMYIQDQGKMTREFPPLCFYTDPISVEIISVPSADTLPPNKVDYALATHRCMSLLGAEEKKSPVIFICEKYSIHTN